MASQINPNNINGAYPVAGQDNDSQGFRDNFTNTQTNFAYASAEITDLQNKALLKAPLDGSTTYNNNMAGAKIIAAQLQATQATVVELGTVTGTVTINYAAGHYQYNVSTTGPISLNFTNFPTAGGGVTPEGWIIVRLTISNVAHTVTLPSAVGAGSSADSVLGIQGFNSNVITFAETGTYELAFNSTDGGASIYMHELTRPRVYFTNPLVVNGSENLTNGSAASLTKPTSYFTTAIAETATLAAGTEGQVKVFAMYSYTDDMVITVTNAGWHPSGTGTLTFSATGQACTLQYINSKWFVIGNNGVTLG